MRNRLLKKRLNNKKHSSKGEGGFTIIEIIIVIAIIGVLAVTITLGLNPMQQLAKARNNERKTHLSAILNALGQRISDNDGNFNCSSGSLPTSTKRMANTTSTPSSTYDIAPCLVTDYLATMPYDSRSPETASTTFWTSITSYNTGYDILKNATTGRITLSAPYAELGETITITR